MKLIPLLINYSLLCIIICDSASQSQPEPTRAQVFGEWGQDCTPPFDDNPPDNCIEKGQRIYSPGGKMECAENFDCCLCGSIKCGFTRVNGKRTPCTEFHVNGDSGAFGVKNIDIIGSPVSGAVLNCGGDHACEQTGIWGRNIAEITCAGDHACAQSMFDLTCLKDMPCSVNCRGDNACSSGTEADTAFIIDNTAGLSCADEACSSGLFILESNIGGGSVICHGEEACTGASITINNVESVQCGGVNACKDANIRVIDPMADFALECTAAGSCHGMDLEIFLSEQSSVDFFKGFNCNGAQSCHGASVTVINYSDSYVTIEKLECGAVQSCKAASFDIVNGGFENCKCGAHLQQSCEGTTGIESCFSGLDKLECFGMNSCEGKTQSLLNIANDFELICGSLSACKYMKLTVTVNGNNAETVTGIKGYKCGADHSCEGAVISFINTSNEGITIDKIECDGINACKNALFKVSGTVTIGDLVCGGTSACSNCKVQRGTRRAVSCSSI